MSSLFFKTRLKHEKVKDSGRLQDGRPLILKIHLAFGAKKAHSPVIISLNIKERNIRKELPNKCQFYVNITDVETKNNYFYKF